MTIKKAQRTQMRIKLINKKSKAKFSLSNKINSQIVRNKFTVMKYSSEICR